MVKFQVMSDTHFDAYSDEGVGFIRSLKPTADIDALVIAGDMCEVSCWRFKQIVESLCARYPHVIYVMGNHERWSVSKQVFDEKIDDVKNTFSNLHILENDVFVLNGQRFVGSTMWWEDNYLSRLGAKSWVDFRHIPNFQNWIWDKIEESNKFLNDEVKKGDIVITHHLPLSRSIDPRYLGKDASNCFYLNNQSKLIEKSEPSYWVHGHTHVQQNYYAGDTRIICNPLGYPGEYSTDYIQDLTFNI